jgi:uncharacterized phage protein (TIGR02220 family)
MKAVLINIIMPQKCSTCPIHNGCENADYAIRGDDGEIIPLLERPTDCPLKEIELPDADNDSKSNDIKEIIEYLNLSTGSSYRANTPKTVQMIKARMREGFTVDDFKTVIDKKVRAWGKDPKMQEFLRPVTLFGTKFESYLNEKCTSRLGENSFQRMQRLAREGAWDE